MVAPGKKGRLFTIEGVDGSGKTTQCRRLVEALAGLGLDSLYCKEPTEGPFGQKIKDLADLPDKLPVEEEMALFIEDRKWNVAHNIMPALLKRRAVVMDRYYFSTAAYQGIRGIDWRTIIRKNEAFAPRPDLVFILDMDPEAGLRRIAEKRGGIFNRYFERLDDLRKVKGIFDQMQGDYIRHLDASASIEAIHQKILNHVRELFSRES